MFKQDYRLMKIEENRDINYLINRIKQEEKGRWRYFPEAAVNSFLISLFAIGMLFNEPSKLEREVIEIGKQATYSLTVDHDTTTAIEYILKGMEKCWDNKKWNLYTEYIHQAVMKLDNPQREQVQEKEKKIKE